PGTQYVDTDLPNGTTFFYRVQAVGANSACDSPVSACAQGTPQPFAGTVKFNQPAYACSSLMQISVLDANIGAGTTTVQVSSTVEPTPETVVLTETSPGSAKYVGTLQATASASSSGDGLLAVADGATITASYLDADDGQGGSNLTRTAVAGSDCVPPQISAIQTTGVTDARADVRWSTNESSSSIVRWGENVPPDRTATTAGNVTSHVVALNGLQGCTVYYYGVESSDAPGNVVSDTRSGQYYSFETLGNFGDGLQPCRAGKLTVLTPTVGCQQTLQMKVVDLDLNANTTAADTVAVTVSSTTETTPETVVLTETGVNTSIFTGAIATTPNAVLPGDGLLSAASGDLLTATYNDASAGTGQPAVSFQTAVADCASPTFSNVRVTDVSDDGAIVRWDTQESSSSTVEWGTTPALGNVVSDAALVQAHAVTVRPFAECARVYFRVTSTDAYGNSRVYDASGSPFEFNAFRIPGLFRDEFESTTGWTLEGEWQIQAPEGRGTSPGDPTAAFQGTRVLGLDLSGLGAKPGDYEINTTTRAVSPVINASSLANGQLKFRRWLNVGGGAVAYVEVRKNNAWNAVWNSSGATGLTESAWSLQSVDIGAFADANNQLQIAFRVTSGFSQTSNRAGWNVDRFVVKSANQPDFDVCGGCGGAPTFAGLDAATDVGGCADTGIRLSWKAAPAWGTGAAGTYSVYRSTDPAFVPSAGNRIAAGIAGTTYTDASAPNDTTFYYVVRAENAESCSTGPANGGVTDANLVRRWARDETAQAAPGTVGATVLASPVNDAHVRLSWTASPTAATYRILRAQAPQGPFTQVAEVAGTYWEDKDQLGDTANRFYQVKTADVCGNPEP
ncbi:MAG TPA: hypothetical protein VF139_17385, partial [Candidatus Polarisedimenticolaceae bacterium]